MNTPDTTLIILEKLCTQIFKKKAPVYFVLDRSGHIQSRGGHLPGHDIAEPKEASVHICKLFDFMEGILPLKGKSMDFSGIHMPSGSSLSDEPETSHSNAYTSSIDAHLFKTDDGYGLIIWKTRDDKEKSREDIFLSKLFQSMNFAVLEMDHQGHFVLIGTPPAWIEQLPQSSRKLKGKTEKEDVFSFLGNFIQDIKSRWDSNPQDSFKTGIWTVKDNSDQELFFEATAVNIQGRQLLIISHDICHPDEKN